MKTAAAEGERTRGERERRKGKRASGTKLMALEGAYALALLAAIVALGVSLSWSSDFIGDDHVFLAWSRYAPSPWAALTSDVHGGEYYRPLPLLWWWVLGRLGQGHAPAFAWFMTCGHAAAAWLVSGVVRRAGERVGVARGAGAIFFLAPAQLDAISWYAASTDLFACLALLLALRTLASCAPRGRRGLGTFAFLGLGLLAKESSAVFPAMLLVWEWAQPRRGRVRPLPEAAGDQDPGASSSDQPEAAPSSESRRAGGRPARFVGLAVAASLMLVVYLSFRRHVLHGWGGAGDPLPSLAARGVGLGWALLTWLSGTGAGTDPVLAALMGAGVVGLLVILSRLPSSAVSPSAALAPERPSALRPALLLGLSLLPLLAVAEPSARRYTYVAAFPLAWLAARALFSRGLSKLGAAALVALLASSVVQISARAREIARYRARLEAARVAVEAGLAAGHRLFHVASGIKDLDLAIKEWPPLQDRRAEFLVLSDVPASFAFRAAVRDPALLAAPPLPPSGAYRFGAEELVGLARRGDEPTLAEAFARWPELRLLRLCAPATAAFCDVTTKMRDAAKAEGSP